jgi:hypothetical protein
LAFRICWIPKRFPFLNCCPYASAYFISCGFSSRGPFLGQYTSLSPLRVTFRHILH